MGVVFPISFLPFFIHLSILSIPSTLKLKPILVISDSTVVVFIATIPILPIPNMPQFLCLVLNDVEVPLDPARSIQRVGWLILR